MSNKINKNQLIHEIKKKLKTDKKAFFPNNTIVELDRYEEYIPTHLITMFVKGDVLYINTYTEQYGVETDKVSDFHQDYVKIFYNLMYNN